jgi:acyl-CoA thioester hydrolase
VCAESRCEYVRSAAFPDALEAGLRVAQIGTSSVTYEIGIFERGELSASGHFVHVFVDRKTRKPTAIPAGIRAALERIHCKHLP